MSDLRLEKLRHMESTIGTFTTSELIADPKFVYETYLEHAETHMSLGDLSNYVSSLIKWVKNNQGTLIGAITGEYGYGKTSTAIYLWQQCEKENIIAVPPFEWNKLQDIVDGTWAWVRYKINNIEPRSVSIVDAIYKRYQAKSIQEFSESEEISVSKVQDLVNRRKVHLECNSENVIDFISEMSECIEKIGGWYGPLIFTDELQVTMSEYQTRHLSRDEFMQDLFGLLNPLLNKKGSYGLIIGLPLNTETIINGARPDILQRLQNCNFYIRPNNMYTRSFPKSLWDKFANTFQFQDISSDILSDDTLDSFGQIAFRNDLGAGPRTVIRSMQIAIKSFDERQTPYTPIDLINDYLENKIAFDSGGKLIAAVNEVLQSTEVLTLNQAAETIKLMSAFPFGCPDSHFERYGLTSVKDELTRKLYTEYLYRYPEGISLRKLAPTERGAEPRFIELTKEFIQTYSESDRDIDTAVNAFNNVVIFEQFLDGANRRSDQIEGWIRDPQNRGVFSGTFDRRYPERKVAFKASNDKNQLVLQDVELGIGFYLMPNCDYSLPGKIEIINNENSYCIVSLNLLCRSTTPLNIPYIEDLGYPITKVTPAFMLSLLYFLRSRLDQIPEDEKRIQIPTFERRLIDSSIELLLNSDLHTNSDIHNLSKVGKYLPEEIFSRLCKLRYPFYETLITTGRWVGNYTQLISALENNKISTSIGVLRGNKSIKMPVPEALSLLSETRIQTLKGLIENLNGCLEFDSGNKNDSTATIKFKLHPAEEAFMELLRTSEEKKKRGNDELHALEEKKALNFLLNQGYRLEEIGIILKLLKTRRLIGYDEGSACFLEILESPDERRESILSSLSDLEKKMATLSEIPDFDSDEFQAIINRLQSDVTNCNDIEKLEDYQSKLVDLSSKLIIFIKKWADKLTFDLEKAQNEVIQISNSSLPDELNTSLKSDVNWVGELSNCQLLLIEKYQKSISNYKSIGKQITSGLKEWSDASSNNPNALITLYNATFNVKTQMKSANIEISSAKAYLVSYLAWSRVLNIASTIYKEALRCKATYKFDEFKDEVDSIFEKIFENLNKKRLESLANHEIFYSQLQNLQSKIDAWIRDRRDIFMQMKISFENSIRDLSISQFNIRVNFDPYDPSTSRENLYDEVLEKIGIKISELVKDFKRYSTEVLFAERVFSSDVSKVKQELKLTNSDLERIKNLLTIEDIKDQSSFDKLCEEVRLLQNNLFQISESVHGVLEKRLTSSDEDNILNLLQDLRETDLSNLIVQRISIEGEMFSLDSLLKVVLDLFKKNQVIIRIEKRR